MQTDIDFFVFYLDMTLESENGRLDALVLDSFMARHRSLILTSRIREYGQLFPHAAAIEKMADEPSRPILSEASHT